jgi:hypothetical protein
MGASARDKLLGRIANPDTPANVSDELYGELRRHFSDEQLIELAASAAQENHRARYNRVFDVGSDEYRSNACAGSEPVSVKYGYDSSGSSRYFGLSRMQETAGRQEQRRKPQMHRVPSRLSGSRRYSDRVN